MSPGSEFATVENRYVQRLHRSVTDRVVAGVCGGIAEYLAIDPSLVRIAFVVGTLWGIGLLIYIVLATSCQSKPVRPQVHQFRASGLTCSREPFWSCLAPCCWRATWVGRRG